MRIRTKLTLQFAIIVALILLIFSFAVYYASSRDREQLFRSRIKERGMTISKLLFEVEEVSRDLLHIIERNTIALPEEQITIYDFNGRVVFSTPDSILKMYDKSFLAEVSKNGEAEITLDSKDIVGFTYPSGSYIVISEAYDRYGFIKLQNLRIILLASFIISVLITILAGWFYSGQALKPIQSVVDEVDKITATKLNVRLNPGNNKDEISQLMITFNNMLERLESAFEMQRSFVSNASHELRTPLTAITGQIEVTLMNKRNTEEYEQILSSILEDIRNMNSLVNGLLDLAQASLDISLLKLQKTRVDETLWQARSDLFRLQSDYSVNITYTKLPEDESALTILGSPQLLKIAFLNVLDNGCKFSKDHSVDVSLNTDSESITLRFLDRGTGISKEDMEKIYQPFYRGSNSQNIHGHGLGLSLTRKIIEIHRGKMSIHSGESGGTQVTITLPLGEAFQA